MPWRIVALFPILWTAKKKPWDWIDRGSYAYLYVGENLAMNFTSAQAAHTALMNSPSHRKNILNDKYRDIGLALVTGEIDGQTTNILVELFGSRQPVSLSLNLNTDHTAGTSAERAVVRSAAPQVLAAEKEPVKNDITAKPKIAVAPVIKKASSTVSAVQPDKPPLLLSSSSTLIASVATATVLAAATDKISTLKTVLESKASNADLNRELVFTAAVNDNKTTLTENIVKISQFAYLVLLVLLIIALLINIFIKIKVQHKPVIIQTCLVIFFIIGLSSLHFHWLERIGSIIVLI